ncbi:MAG: 2-amino-4-hydroxy-6-hydroxymethyldihydropteridine diphosphokinase [Halieaceae bacterium]|jgi:2-amino-4-hydroxy-6-hydroxymethyldihydropteridine diphosphokinase
MNSCYIGIGANLGEPARTLRWAAAALHDETGCRVTHYSPIYQSAPIGPTGQPDYLNAVLAVETALAPLPLLDRLQAFEDAAGRQRGVQWGPRTLDLDLLLYDSLVFNIDRLQLPHPRLRERNFVLQPLADICGADFALPDGSTLREHLAECPANPLRRLEISLRETHRVEAG